MKRDKKRDTTPTNALQSHLTTILALLAEADATGISIEQLIGAKVADWYNLHSSSKEKTEDTSLSKVPKEIEELLDLQATLKVLFEQGKTPIKRRNKQIIYG